MVTGGEDEELGFCDKFTPDRGTALYGHSADGSQSSMNVHQECTSARISG